MKYLSFLSCLLVGIAFQACDKHFITDADYRARVETDFQHQMQKMGDRFFRTDSLNPTREELEALQFLYAYMPLADVTDYSTEFYLSNVRTALQARAEMAWGKQVPELLFRHFVLPVRVNNEQLDNARQVFFYELKERVSGMSMKEAILEVNHWCHELVTYRPSDARTSSPLATIQSAYGRCGEESTFTVAALRSIGIPARQVYTPRWAHTDDNHAWVEAWADGQWYFMGACEPEPVLNLGWFNAPASRAMLMHTRVYGRYNGPEEVMLQTFNVTEINLIDNYGSTARVDFRVVDDQGRDVPEARVDFKIYNYAEFYPAVTKYADANGRTFLTAGKGDMVAWASKDGKYGFAKVSFGTDKEVTIRLAHDAETGTTPTDADLREMDIVPPQEQVNTVQVTLEQRQANDRRKAMEDAHRQAYMETFLTTDEALEVCHALGYGDDMAELLVKSSGNHPYLTQFLEFVDRQPAPRQGDKHARALELLRSLSDKDLRDVPVAVLIDSYTAENSVLCPRVEDEFLTPYKHYLLSQLPKSSQEAFRASPSRLAQWCKDSITLDTEVNNMRVAMSPKGVWLSRVADERSRDIFFVALARTLGIEARKDVVTGKIQYQEDGEWLDVDFDKVAPSKAAQGTLVLDYQPTRWLENPSYYSHFTISRITEGTTRLMTFDEGQVDMGGGVSWLNTFKNGALLDEGTYLLVTGTRLASGAVLATTRLFRVDQGQTTRLDLTLRQAQDEIAVIGQFDSETKYTDVARGVEQSILAATGRGYFVTGVLGVGQEPTNHALRDLAAESEALEKWGRPILLLFENDRQLRQFESENYGRLPSTVILGIDSTQTVRRQLTDNLNLKDKHLLPLFIISDTFNRVVFVSQGYTIGLGAQLRQVIGKL